MVSWARKYVGLYPNDQYPRTVNGCFASKDEQPRSYDFV